MREGLVKLANHLDQIGHRDLADKLDSILKKAQVTGINPDTGGTYTWAESKPKTLQEFNAYLASLMMDLNLDQKIVDATKLDHSVRTNPEELMKAVSVPSAWVSGTSTAFEEFAKLSGEEEAAIVPAGITLSNNQSAWTLYAEKNGYYPTLRGMFDFWGKNIDRVRAGMSRNQETVQSVNRKHRESMDKTPVDKESYDAWLAEHTKENMPLYRESVRMFKEEGSKYREEVMRDPARSKFLKDSLMAVEGLDSSQVDTRIAQMRVWDDKSETAVATDVPPESAEGQAIVGPPKDEEDKAVDQQTVEANERPSFKKLASDFSRYYGIVRR